LLALKPELRQVDLKSLGEWFACGCVLQNRSLFKGISLLPSGSAWIFSGAGQVTKNKYFNPATWERQERLSETEYSDQLVATFPRILERYVQASAPVGMSLTGGLDGRLIMAWANRPAGALPCYTFNGPVRDCADVKIARRLATACGQPHRTLPIGGDFLAAFPKLAAETVALSDGAMDVSGAAELYLNRAAREISPIRLTGNYGSEILRNNVAFRPRALTPGLFQPDFETQLAAAAHTYHEEFQPVRPRSFIAFKQMPWHHYARFAVERSQVSVRSPYLDNDLVALAFRAPAASESSPDPMARVVSAGKPELWRIPTDRGVTYPASPVNRLRRAAAECAAKAEYAFDYGMPPWLARLDHALSPLHLERWFLGRQKFCHYRIWYRDALAPYVREMLLDSRTLGRPYLQARTVEALVNGHLSGRNNFTVEIHKLLTAELLWRQLIEG
jgi:asparagine synthase (glutamine-hydrolysing)